MWFMQEFVLNLYGRVPELSLLHHPTRPLFRASSVRQHNCFRLELPGLCISRASEHQAPDLEENLV